MGNDYRHRVTSWWASGQTGLSKTDSSPNAIHFAAPPQFGGVEGRWTPEDLLICALASCFTTTFHAVAKNPAFEYTDLEVEVEGVVSRSESGYQFSLITIRPNLTIVREEDRDRAFMLLQKSKELCLVSRALAAPQKFESSVLMGNQQTV